MVTHDHGIPMVSLTVVKTAVNLPCRAQVFLAFVRFRNQPTTTHGFFSVSSIIIIYDNSFQSTFRHSLNQSNFPSYPSLISPNSGKISFFGQMIDDVLLIL